MKKVWRRNQLIVTALVILIGVAGYLNYTATTEEQSVETAIQIEATDDMHDSTKVGTNYSSMMEKGMQVSLGTVTTGPGAEFTKLSKEDNVFFLTPSA